MSSSTRPSCRIEFYRQDWKAWWLIILLSGYYVIDKDIARAYNTKSLCLLIGQILIDNVGR